MSNPIDLCAITLNKVLLIMSKGVRIQPLIFVKNLGIFVEEVGERGILSNPGYKCAEIHPPLASESALLTLLHTFPAQRVIWSLMVPGE